MSHIDPRVASTSIKSGNAANLYLTPLSAIGAIRDVSQTLLRRRCYCTLKSGFTIADSVRKDHKLVTRGPYGIVRHPNYSRMLAVHVSVCTRVLLVGFSCIVDEGIGAPGHERPESGSSGLRDMQDGRGGRLAHERSRALRCRSNLEKSGMNTRAEFRMSSSQPHIEND